jgi:hypothetical protein
MVITRITPQGVPLTLRCGRHKPPEAPIDLTIGRDTAPMSRDQAVTLRDALDRAIEATDPAALGALDV